jgi:tRNA-Thr(GGU) m(6)t(6)A37 methyltransferase TsaA
MVSLTKSNQSNKINAILVIKEEVKMAGELKELTHKVIGVVRNAIKEPGRRSDLQEITSDVVLYPEYAEGLDNLDKYSHAIVIYEFHIDNKPGPKPMKQHSHNQESLPLVGIFALRGSNRPNRIGLCMTKIVKIEGGKMTVTGLDAIDGSPVIDIKPYIPRIDSVADAKIAPWEADFAKH